MLGTHLDIRHTFCAFHLSFSRVLITSFTGNLEKTAFIRNPNRLLCRFGLCLEKKTIKTHHSLLIYVHVCFVFKKLTLTLYLYMYK